MSPLFYIGLTLAIFKGWGDICPDKEALKICARCLAMRPEQLLYNLFGMLSIPQGLLLRDPIVFITTSVLAGKN